MKQIIGECKIIEFDVNDSIDGLVGVVRDLILNKGCMPCFAQIDEPKRSCWSIGFSGHDNKIYWLRVHYKLFYGIGKKKHQTLIEFINEAILVGT